MLRRILGSATKPEVQNVQKEKAFPHAQFEKSSLGKNAETTPGQREQWAGASPTFPFCAKGHFTKTGQLICFLNIPSMQAFQLSKIIPISIPRFFSVAILNDTETEEAHQRRSV